jgi:hypothetical protein
VDNPGVSLFLGIPGAQSDPNPKIHIILVPGLHKNPENWKAVGVQTVKA